MSEMEDRSCRVTFLSSNSYWNKSETYSSWIIQYIKTLFHESLRLLPYSFSTWIFNRERYIVSWWCWWKITKIQDCRKQLAICWHFQMYFLIGSNFEWQNTLNDSNILHQPLPFFTHQLQPLDTTMVSEIRHREDCRGLLTASAVVEMEWTSKTFDSPVVVSQVIILYRTWHKWQNWSRIEHRSDSVPVLARYDMFTKEPGDLQ